MNSKLFFVLGVSLLLYLSACDDKGDPVMPPTSNTPPKIDTVSFSKDIFPLLTATYGCTGCHSGGYANAQNHQSYESYEFVLSGNSGYSTIPKSDHGPVVTPGNASTSILVKKLRTATLPFGSRMPYGGGEVSANDLQKITDWINQGAHNN
ncbi:MAG: hypothetical protein PHP42_09010 [Bacteroidota bacterium]|nr:hypothetical protein [Bacteroidota bacterium]